jgi:hypothetical protein
VAAAVVAGGAVVAAAAAVLDAGADEEAADPGSELPSKLDTSAVVPERYIERKLVPPPPGSCQHVRLDTSNE